MSKQQLLKRTRSASCGEMFWTILTEGTLLLSSQNDSSHEGDDFIHNNNSKMTTMDIDSVIVLAEGIQAFNVNGGTVQIPYYCLSSTSPAVTYCENKKMLSHLTRSVVGETTFSDRFVEFTLCGFGDDRLFVLLELQLTTVDVLKRNNAGIRWEKEDLHKLRSSYMEKVVSPSVRKLNSDSETHLTFGNRQGRTTCGGGHDNVNVHASDWCAFGTLLKINESDWMIANNIENVYYYKSVRGRRFPIHDARQFLQRWCDKENSNMQIMCQIRYAESIALSAANDGGGVGYGNSACFIDLAKIKSDGKALFGMCSGTERYFTPYGLCSDVGYFCADTDSREIFPPLPFPRDVHVVDDDYGHNNVNRVLKMYSSYIQVYDPLVRAFRDRHRSRRQLIAPYFLLGLHKERARRTRYIENVENLKDKALIDLQDWKDFVGKCAENGNSIRIEAVLNFDSTANDDLAFFFETISNIERGGGGGAGEEHNFHPKIITPMAKYFCDKKLIMVCIGGWREWVHSTAGSFLNTILNECSDFPTPNSEDEQQQQQETSTKNIRRSRHDMTFAECFQFVYDAELRLLQWARGHADDLNSPRWKLQFYNDEHLTCGSGNLISTVSLLNYVPLSKMKHLDECPDDILFDNTWRNIANLIWSTASTSSATHRHHRMESDTYEICTRDEVQRLIRCHGIRYSSVLGLNDPPNAEVAFTLDRIQNHRRRNKGRRIHVSGSISPETVARWIIGTVDDNNYDIGHPPPPPPPRSINDLLINAIVSEQTDDVTFRNALIDFIKEHVEIFPDLSVAGYSAAGRKFRDWRLVGSGNDETRIIWINVLAILKDELRLPPKCLKSLPRNVSDNWQLELIECINDKVDAERNRNNALSSTIAFVVSVNIMGNVPIHDRKINFAAWKRFIKKERLPVSILKLLGFIANGNVYEDIGGIPGGDWKRILASRYERRTLQRYGGEEHDTSEQREQLQEPQPSTSSTSDDSLQQPQTLNYSGTISSLLHVSGDANRKRKRSSSDVGERKNENKKRDKKEDKGNGSGKGKSKDKGKRSRSLTSSSSTASQPSSAMSRKEIKKLRKFIEDFCKRTMLDPFLMPPPSSVPPPRRSLITTEKENSLPTPAIAEDTLMPPTQPVPPPQTTP